MVTIILVVLRENSKRLFASHTSVVAAFSSLYGLRSLCDCTAVQKEVRMWRTCSCRLPEHLGLEGYLPFVFEVAGSRVAVAAMTRVRTVMKDWANMFGIRLIVVSMSD